MLKLFVFGSSIGSVVSSQYFKNKSAQTIKIFQKVKKCPSYDFDYLENPDQMLNKYVAFCAQIEKYEKQNDVKISNYFFQKNKEDSIQVIDKDYKLVCKNEHGQIINIQTDKAFIFNLKDFQQQQFQIGYKYVFLGKYDGEVFQTQTISSESKENLLKYLDSMIIEQQNYERQFIMFGFSILGIGFFISKAL